jgi:hypothetical protein
MNNSNIELEKSNRGRKLDRNELLLLFEVLSFRDMMFGLEFILELSWSYS